MSEPKHEALWFPVFGESHLGCFGALRRGSAIKTLFWALLGFLKETSRCNNGIHGLLFSAVNPSLPTLRLFFWASGNVLVMQKLICSPWCTDSPRLCHPQRRKKEAFPPQECEILFEIFAGFFFFFPAVPPNLSDHWKLTGCSKTRQQAQTLWVSIQCAQNRH